MLFLWIIVSIIMFSIIVVLHEYGHYKTAKIFWIHVEEFGLWIPPRAKKLWKNKSGTLFSLNWIPLGGFVKITWENESQRDMTRSWENFFEKNIWQKSLVLLAGVIMNFLLAAGIFIILFFIGVKPVGINSIIETELPSKLIPTFEQSLSEWIIIEESGIILYPTENSPAELAGIEQWDILLSVNSLPVWDIASLQKIISESAWSTLSFEFREKTLEISVWDDGKIGSYLAPNYQVQEDFIYKYWIFESVKFWFLETYYQIRLTLSGIKMLAVNIFTPETPQDRSEALEQVAGPIGIVWVISNAMSGGWKLLLILWAIISINLWVFNLLPIPALDWGRLLLLWIRTALEKIFWKQTVFTNIENLIHVIFFITLIALSILIAYNDILNISSR